MIDKNGRSIDYLRISVTDRCNLRCIYCMPEGGVHELSHGEILRYEEITHLVRLLAKLGVKHLRVTGGEPMSRRNCPELIAQLHALEGIESISMTSNGILLNDKISQLKQAGLSALNLSLDTLDPDTFARITRGGDISKVLKTLQQALAEGLNVKINAIPVRGVNDGELADLARLAKMHPLYVRFIELMPIGCARDMKGIPPALVLQQLKNTFGEPLPDDTAHGYGPARYYKFPDFAGSVGFISAVSHEFCDSCNRVRLTADGRLKLCLNHSQGLDLRTLLRSGASDNEILEAMQKAIADKPRRHAFYETISDREEARMNSIGG